MQFSVIIAAILSSAVLNMASPLAEHQAYNPCTGVASGAQCCALDALGFADLDCAAPPSTPADKNIFTAICAAEGKQAQCCVLPLIGQPIFCTGPV